MATLSTLGIIHTAISLVALGAGIRSLFRYKEITPATAAGLVYIGMTVLTCLTGFFIFAHGGFGKPHALGVLTLLVLGVAAVARFTSTMGRSGPAVEVVAYSLTFFFHMIPGMTETATRLPVAAPFLDSPDSPVLVFATGLLFAVFVAGAVWQVRRLRRAAPGLPGRRLPTRAV